MPRSARSSCSFPGCRNKAIHGARCDQHKRAGEESPYRGFYRSAPWKATRLRVLREQPTCACPGCPEHEGRCQDRATDVDHIVSMTDGGAMLARSNLQGLCEPCHYVKTWADRNRRAAR